MTITFSDIISNIGLIILSCLFLLFFLWYFILIFCKSAAMNDHQYNYTDKEEIKTELKKYAISKIRSCNARKQKRDKRGWFVRMSR